MNNSLNVLLCELIKNAKDRKYRKLQRLQKLKGDWISTPSRGPIQKNKMNCIRWHFYKAAEHNHQKITDQITQLASLIKVL
jgi:hypothetical protein